MKEMKKISDEIILQGIIVSGRGTGAKRMNLLAPFFKENGIDIFPGTLNIVFSGPIYLNKANADFSFSNYFFWKAKINNIDCYLYRWWHCPAHIVEILASSKLRDRINTSESQLVTLNLERSIIQDINFMELFLWNLVWRGRTEAYYTNDLYTGIIGKFLNLKYRITHN